MKTLSKVLSMLLVIVMCVGLFGTSAYALNDLAPLGGDYQQGGLDSLAPIGGNDDEDDYDEPGNALAPIAPADGSTIQSNEGEIGALEPLDRESGISTLSVGEKVAKVNNKEFEDFALAIAELNKSGGTLTLYQDVTLSENVTINAGAAVTINLKSDNTEHTLSLGSNMFYVKSGTLTIKNGTIENDDSIAEVADSAKVTIDNVHASKPAFTTSASATSNVKVTTTCSFDSADGWSMFYSTNSNYTLADSDGDGVYTFEKNAADVAAVVNVNTKKEYKESEIDQAFADVESGQTLRFIKVSDQGEDYTIGDIALNKAITIDTQNNSLSGSITLTGSRTLTLKGYEFDGKITLENKATLTLGDNIKVGEVELSGSSTLNAGNAGSIGTVSANSSTVNVSGSVTIDNLSVGAGTLKVTGGTINSLSLSGKNTLTVTGGVIGDADLSGATVNNKGVSGGTWNGVDGSVDNEGDEAYFLAQSCVSGYEPYGDNGKYIIQKKGSTNPNPGDDNNNGVTQGNFTLYGSPYTKNSGKNVYITVDSGDIPDGIWMSTSQTLTSSNNWNINDHISSLSSTIYIDNDYLDSSSVGVRTYYLWAGYTNSDGKVTSSKLVGKLVVNKSSSNNGGGVVIPGDGIEVGARYENEWYQGDNVLQFYVKPYPEKGGLTLRIDGNPVGNLDWYDYHSGYFYLGTRKLESLESGWHTLTVETEDGIDSCEFYIGATLKAKDTTKHVIGSSKTLKYVCSEPIARVYVSGKLVDSYDDQTNYKLSNDGMTLTLTAAFLNDRTAGHTYTISVDTIYGNSAENTFTILTTAQASSSPKTGDNSNLALWISALVMSGAAAAVVLPKMKKKENEA